MPHPAVRFIAPAPCVSVRPPTGEAAIRVVPPCASPAAATPDFGETFEFPALRPVCTERLLLIGHSSKWLQNGLPRPSMVRSRSQRQRHHHHHEHRAPQRRRTPPLSRPLRRLSGARRPLPLQRQRHHNHHHHRAPQRCRTPPLSRPGRRLTGACRPLPPQRQRHHNHRHHRAPQRRRTPPPSRPWRRLTGAHHPLPPHRQRPSHHPGVWISS